MADPDNRWNNDSDRDSHFTRWLFDEQLKDDGFSAIRLPLLQGGGPGSTLSYDDNNSGTSPSLEHHVNHYGEVSDVCMTASRREEFLDWFRLFRRRQPRYDLQMWHLLQECSGKLEQGILNLPDSDEDIPGLSLAMLQHCLNEFWCTVSPRLPVVHQPTFSPNSCPVFLLLVMVALGAASLKSHDPAGQWSEYWAFADVIMVSIRWELVALQDRQPLAPFWVAQALLLLEYYETLYSTRQLHERAIVSNREFVEHIRKTGLLTGRVGTAPPNKPDGDGDGESREAAVDSRTWWVRWAENESMNRVAFAAFMLDLTHAVLFGVNKRMSPDEIRLPLPCDDSLWTANTPETMRQLDANLRMYGVEEVSFLDGLKRTLHGKEVKTHSFGKMILIYGLLSIGWRMSRRLVHYGLPKLREEGWDVHRDQRAMVLEALESWNQSFDMAMSDSMTDEAPGIRPIPSGLTSSAHLLFHLAQISLHSDVADLQMYAGALRVFCRNVAVGDRDEAASFLEKWAERESARRAVLHSFKLLHKVLVDPGSRKRHDPLRQQEGPIQYSIHDEADLQRPWIMYCSTITIWAFVQVTTTQAEKGCSSTTPFQATQDIYGATTAYLTRVAALQELDDETASNLYQGLPALLEVMEEILSLSYTDLLKEARTIMCKCRNRLLRRLP